uniref:G-protein coupled receptors family 1 profile domain-containing protein n=1 Tax=Hucho hucho TaxID=62062 RepID=A0A4W5KZZ0_9TELE
MLIQYQINQFIICINELAILLLVVYLMILIGKLIILTLVATDPKLQSAMYIFLSNLALTDTVISTSVLAEMIAVCLWNDITISQRVSSSCIWLFW